MTTLTRFQPQLLAILRIAVGLLFLQHGFTKLLGWPETQMSGVALTSLPGIAGLFEFFGGIALVLGVYTRLVAFVLSGLMAVAYFMAHAPQNFFPILNGGELAAVYSFVFLYLAAAGAGPWSIDSARSKG